MEKQASFTLVLPEEEEEESMCIWLSHEKRPYFGSSFIHLPMYVVYTKYSTTYRYINSVITSTITILLSVPTNCYNYKQ